MLLKGKIQMSPVGGKGEAASFVIVLGTFQNRKEISVPVAGMHCGTARMNKVPKVRSVQQL